MRLSATERRMRSPLRTAAERPADGRLRRDVQHDRAEGGAAHARVGDAHHVLDARPARASSGSAGSPPPACRPRCGPAFCSTSTSSGVDVEVGVVDAGRRGPRGSSKTTARPSARTGRRSAAARLKMAPSGASVPESATRPPTGEIGSVERADDAAVDPAGRLVEALGQRAALDVDGVEVQQRAQLAQHGAHAAGGVEILHVAVADRLEVDQHRRLVGERVEARRADRDAERGRRWRSDGRWRWSSRRSPSARGARSRPTSRVMIWRGVSRRWRSAATARLAGLLGGDAAGRRGRRGSRRCRAATCRAPRRCRPWCWPCPSPRRCRRSPPAGPRPCRSRRRRPSPAR